MENLDHYSKKTLTIGKQQSQGSSKVVNYSEHGENRMEMRSPLKNLSNIEKNTSQSRADDEEMKSIHLMAEGIRSKTISDADILSMSIQKSGRKKQIQAFLEKNTDDEVQPKEIFRTLFAEPEEHPSECHINPNMDNGDLLFQVLERSAKKKGLTVDDMISSVHIQPKTLQYEDTNYVEEPYDIHFNDETQCSTEERHKLLKHKMKEQILSTLQNQLLSILNNGRYEELTKLKGIGHTRAQRIIELRSSKDIQLEDLDEIGMKPALIKKLFHNNISNIIDLLDEGEEEEDQV